MDLSVSKDVILKDPLIEHTICSFGSMTKGIGRLNIVVNLITKEVNYKVIGNTGTIITESLDEAIVLYNSLGKN